MHVTNRGKGVLESGQVARLLNVHINTVRRWANQGILKAYRPGLRGHRRFEAEDIEDYLVNNKSP